VERVLALAILSSLVHSCESGLAEANFSRYSQPPVRARALAIARLGPAFKGLVGVTTGYLASNLTASSGCWFEIWLTISRLGSLMTIIRVLKMR